MTQRTSRKLFLLLALIGAPAATYRVIVLLTDGLGIIQENWGWLILLLPPLFTMLAGRATRQTTSQVAVASIGAIALTFGLVVVLIYYALHNEP